NGQLSQVGKIRKPPTFERCREGVSEMSCRDGVIKQRLAAHGFIPENTKGNAVTFRVEAPVLESQRRKHPTAAAHAGDGDYFSLQVRRIFDFGRRHDVANEFINHAGNKYQISSLRGGAEYGAGDRAFMQLRFACGESGHTDGPVPDMDEG